MSSGVCSFLPEPHTQPALGGHRSKETITANRPRGWNSRASLQMGVSTIKGQGRAENVEKLPIHLDDPCQCNAPTLSTFRGSAGAQNNAFRNTVQSLASKSYVASIHTGAEEKEWIKILTSCVHLVRSFRERHCNQVGAERYRRKPQSEGPPETRRQGGPRRPGCEYQLCHEPHTMGAWASHFLLQLLIFLSLKQVY